MEMETERIHNLIEQDHSVQRTCFMHNGNFSHEASLEPHPDKFSPSKIMLMRDCSKRPSATVRELSVPPKKRKHIHEESDMCDAFTDHNMQKIENNEDVGITFCSKFKKESLHGSTSSASENQHEEGKIEFNLQSSVYVKADNSAEWTRLKCFDSISVDGSNDTTFFVGGPIQSSAFSIIPHDVKVNQYIAVAASNAIYNSHSITDTKSVKGIIQFWNLGSLYERKTLNHSPSMEFALYHENGIITQMKWCPTECNNMYSSSCSLPRLGLLAASSSDSCVYIYNVPQPDFMPKSKSTIPIYFTVPFMKLIPLFGGPSNATKKSVATCIEWENKGEQIIAGYGNGTVCVWMLKISSFASHIAVKNKEQSYIVQPYLFFQASGASISSLTFPPLNNFRWLAVTSIDKILRFFDLQDTSAPFHAVKQGLENSCVWGDTFCGVYSFPALNSMGLISLSAKDCYVENNDKGVQKGFFDISTHVAVSENKRFHAMADMAGTVTVNILKNFCKPLESSYLTYVIFETEIMAFDTVDQELKTLGCEINISGYIPNNITFDTKGASCSEIKQGSSSSSSGFCSLKQGKTFEIKTSKCFDEDAVNVDESSPGCFSTKGFYDIDELNKPINSDEETNDEMIKGSDFEDDLMRNLLMVKISNQAKLSSHILPLNTSNNSAYCNSKGAKYLSDGGLTASPATSDSDNTIIYSIEPIFCDTSQPNTTPASQETPVHKKKEKLTLKTDLFTETKLNFSSTDLKSENSCPNENSSSKNWCKSNFENCYLNYKSRNFRVEYNGSKQSPKKMKKNEDSLLQNLQTKDNSNEDAIIRSPHASDYSGDTIIYRLESDHGSKTDDNYLKIEKPGANTFQDTSFANTDEKIVLHGSQSKLTNSFFAEEKFRHLCTEDSLKYDSEYETDSATKSCDSGDEDRNFFLKEFSISDFYPLHLEYVSEKSEEKHANLKEVQKNNLNSQELSYENHLTNFGVIFKNNLDKSTNPLKRQENDVYIKTNPLSVIKTISWNPNKGCHFWLFVGGNSGIGRLVYVPDFVDETPQPRVRKKQPAKPILT